MRFKIYPFIVLSSFWMMMLPNLVLSEAKEDYLKGRAAEDRGEYKKSEDWYLKAAKQGYSKAMNRLGWHYDWLGLGGRDGKQCLTAGKEKIDQLEKMGICRLLSKGKKPREEAAKWFGKACKHGSSAGCSGLARYFREGKGGIERDGAKAAKLFRRALRLPDSEHEGIDLIYLADLYQRGEGVEQNDVLAQMWLELAESRGAMDYRYDLTREIRGYLQVMSPAKFDEASRKAKKCVASHYKHCD